MQIYKPSWKSEVQTTFLFTFYKFPECHSQNNHSQNNPIGTLWHFMGESLLNPIKNRSPPKAGTRFLLAFLEFQRLYILTVYKPSSKSEVRSLEEIPFSPFYKSQVCHSCLLRMILRIILRTIIQNYYTYSISIHRTFGLIHYGPCSSQSHSTPLMALTNPSD